jgi:hypothetical protein
VTSHPWNPREEGATRYPGPPDPGPPIAKEPAGCTTIEVPNGWYAKLFLHPQSSIEQDLTVADVHTQPADAGGTIVGHVLQVGTSFPRLFVTTVDTCVGPRAYAGVVYSYHERIAKDFERLTDEWTRTCRPRRLRMCRGSRPCSGSEARLSEREPNSSRANSRTTTDPGYFAGPGCAFIGVSRVNFDHISPVCCGSFWGAFDGELLPICSEYSKQHPGAVFLVGSCTRAVGGPPPKPETMHETHETRAFDRPSRAVPDPGRGRVRRAERGKGATRRCQETWKR